MSEEMAVNHMDSLIKEIERLQTRVIELERQLNIDRDCEVGDIVIFALFGKETIGVVTKKVVVIDAGSGELEIDSNNIIRVVNEIQC